MIQTDTLRIPPELREEWNLLCQGTVDIIPREEFLEKLIASRREGRPLRVKMGADPTSPDLHLGHTVPIRKLRQFQDCGHVVVFIIGDFTAQVGDPSGRSETRPQLTPAEVTINARTYLDQIFKILDRSKTEVVYNSQWLAPMGLSDVLRLCSSYTVARMLERDDFKNRYAAGRPIAIHEFLYPLLQGFDSVEVRADVEVGGTDQTFNLLVGRDLQREAGQSPQTVMTLPLLVGLDGVQKMSKSYGNSIGINDPPQDMFGKVMSLPDALMRDYFLLALGYPEKEIDGLLAQIGGGALHPRDLKERLAREIVTIYHGAEAAQAAAEEFARIFREKDIPSDLDEREISATDTPPLAKLLAELGLAASNREARSLIQQGAVKVDGQTQSDPGRVLGPGAYVLKAGKRRFMRVVVK
ncbi:MAG: tyrosine--tRNA ligase [Candidatus Sumerlaeia bacterium]